MEELQDKVISAVVALIGVLIPWVFAKLRQYIDTRIENETLESLLVRLSEAVEVAVRDVAAKFVPVAKEAAHPGKITDRDANFLREKARQAIFTQLSESDHRKLSELFGERLDRKLDQQIEAAVLRRKE